MVLYDFVGLAMVVGMMLVVFDATRFVSSVRFNGKDLWHITVRAYCWRDKRYIDWVRSNRVYHWSCLLITTLIVTILGLIGSFSKSNYFNRPEVIYIISPIIWLSIYKSNRWFTKKIRSLEV